MFEFAKDCYHFKDKQTNRQACIRDIKLPDLAMDRYKTKVSI